MKYWMETKISDISNLSEQENDKNKRPSTILTLNGSKQSTYYNQYLRKLDGIRHNPQNIKYKRDTSHLY